MESVECMYENEKREDQFYKMRELVKIVVKGYSNSLILLSEGGLGKSYTVLQTLKEEGLKDGEEFVYITTFSTPLELYHILYENKDKLVVLDDTEGILTDRKSISILKSALWSANGRRVLNYHSTTGKLQAPESFEFTGKIIFCINEIGHDKIIQSLVSRCLFYRLKFSYQEKLKMMEDIAKSEGIATEVMEFIKIYTTPATRNLNFRTLFHIWNAYRYDSDNGKDGRWKELAKALLETNEELGFVLGLIESARPVNQQVKEFITTRHMSRRTFFRYKQMLR